MIDSDLGGVPREQKMLKGHLPRVIYHQVPKYTTIKYENISPGVMLQEIASDRRALAGQTPVEVNRLRVGWP